LWMGEVVALIFSWPWLQALEVLLNRNLESSSFI